MTRYLEGTHDSSLDSPTGVGGTALLDPPGISADERTVLESGQSASAGISALVVAAGRSTVSAATAVAALSSEALQAQVLLQSKKAVGALALHWYVRDPSRPSVHPQWQQKPLIRLLDQTVPIACNFTSRRVVFTRAEKSQERR